MKKILTIIATLISIAFALCLAIVFYAANWDPNNHKEWIAEKFKEQTGRSLSIDGALNLTLYPWVSLEINQLSISNGAEFSDNVFLQAEHAELRIKLMPILSSQYEIDTILLQDTTLNLEVNTSGQANWDFLSTNADNDSTDTEASITSIGDIVLGGINIQNFNLNFDDRSTNQHYEINDLGMTTGELIYGEPIQFNLSLGTLSTQPELTAQTELEGTITYDLEKQLYNLTPFSLTSSLSGPNIPNDTTNINLTAALDLNLAEGTATLPNFELNALGTQLIASVNASNIQSDSPAINANLSLNGNDLALLFQIAEINDLAEQISSLNNRSFDFSASFYADLASGEFSLPEFSANLLGASIEGEINASAIQTETPTISGHLNASGPDLPTLFGVVGQLQGGIDSSLSEYGRQLSTLTNKSFNINAEFDADLEDGNILVPTLSLNALGLNLNGNFSSQDFQANNGTVDGALTLEANNLSELLLALDQADLAEVAQSLNLNIELSGTRTNIAINPLNLILVLDGKDIPNSPVNIELTAETKVNIEEETISIAKFSLAGLDLLAVGNVDINNILTEPEAVGQLNIAPFNLRQLLQRLNQDIPETSDDTTLTNISLDANFNGSPSKINLDSFNVTLDQSTIQGNFSLLDFDSPVIGFSVAIDQLNADRYLAPESDTNANMPATSENTELPLDTLQALNLNGNLNISQLTISNVNMSDISVSLKAENGQLDISPIRADLYSGNYSGTISLNVENEIPLVNIESSLQEVDLGPLTEDFMDSTYVSGLGNVYFSLNGSGQNPASIKSSLNGNGNFEITAGVLVGVDVASVLAQVELMLRDRRLIDIERGEQTLFENFSGTINIDNGVVSSDDLLILAPGFNVKGNGTLVNLSNDTIRFDLMTTVDPATASNETEEYDLGGYALPIACRGSIDSPSCLPDTEEIIKVALANTIERKLGDFLGTLVGSDEPDDDSSPLDNIVVQPSEQEEEQPVDLRQQLINRALDRFKR